MTDATLVEALNRIYYSTNFNEVVQIVQVALLVTILLVLIFSIERRRG